MPLMDTVIITPWVGFADDPSPQPSNHPRLKNDYPHVLNVSEVLLDEIPEISAAVAFAEGSGLSFRAAFRMHSGSGTIGIGIVAPQSIWADLKAQEAVDHIPVISKYPYLMGPNSNPAETDFEIKQLTLNVTTEGVRLLEDWTGQPAANIVPEPNQYSIHAVMDESVLIALKGDATYYYMSGITIPDDPENPSATPPSPHEKPPEAAMSAADEADYRAWQAAQGVDIPALDQMMLQAKTLSSSNDLLTYGKATVETATWQNQLEPSGSMISEMPTVEMLAKFLRRLRGQVANPAYTEE